MSSSTENCIANGLTFTIADIDITAPKLNKSGGKSANILYKPTKKGLYINLQVPMLTWGASAFKDPQSGKETYDMAIQFPRKDYSSPDTDTLLAKFIESGFQHEWRNSILYYLDMSFFLFSFICSNIIYLCGKTRQRETRKS